MVKPSENPSYIQVRRDMLSMIDATRSMAAILDVGCSRGATSRALADGVDGACHTVGIELDEDAARAASQVLDEVICGDAVESLEQLVARGESFDVVMCGDVLEHLQDPWAALRLIRKLCAPHAQVIISLPNVGHYSTIVALLRQRWPYASRGIHDRTHLRWFARENLNELYEQASFREIKRQETHRLIETPHKLNARTAPLLRRVPVLRALTVFQFLSRLEPT